MSSLTVGVQCLSLWAVEVLESEATQVLYPQVTEEDQGG